ncbi:unnamed protein product [Closterium sp. Yama58-4]|nr:unnamed protein product [Closterium sp. Yama58-4]
MDRSVSARRKGEAPIPAAQESFWSSLVKKMADFVLEDDIPSSRSSTPRHQHSPTLNAEDLLGKPVAGSGVSSSPRRASAKTSSPQAPPGGGKHAGGSKPTQTRSNGTAKFAGTERTAGMAAGATGAGKRGGGDSKPADAAAGAGAGGAVSGGMAGGSTTAGGKGGGGGGGFVQGGLDAIINSISLLGDTLGSALDEGTGKVVQVAVGDRPFFKASQNPILSSPSPLFLPPLSPLPPLCMTAGGHRQGGAEQRMEAREGRAGGTESAASLVSPASLASPPACVSPASPVSPPSLAARPDDPLASPPPQAPGHASTGPTATSAATSTATSGAALAAEDDLLVRLPRGREMQEGREEGVKRASEAAVHVPKETQLVASRNVATAMAMRAKQLQADLKAARRDAMDARERCRALHEQLGVLLQEKAELVAGKAAVERENEMLHHLLLYYEHLYLHRGGTPGEHPVLLPNGGHVLPDGGEHVLLAGGEHVMSAEEHAVLMHEHMHLHGGVTDGHGGDPGTGEAESGATDVTPGGCVGGRENQEEGQERAEEHTGTPLLQPEVAGEVTLDEARRGSEVGGGAEAGGGENREEGQEKCEDRKDAPSLQQQVAAAGSLDEVGGGREVCGGAEPGEGGEVVDGGGVGVRVDGAVLEGMEDEQKVGFETSRNMDEGGEVVDRSGVGVRVDGAVVEGMEDEQKGAAGRGVDDCKGSSVYAGS